VEQLKSIQTFLEEEMQLDENDSENNSHLNAEKDDKEKRVLELLEEVEECKTKKWNWKNNVPAKNALLSVISEESERIKEAKSCIVENFAGKEPHEIFE